MAVREILILPDKRLRLKSDAIKTVDKPLRTLIEDMLSVSRGGSSAHGRSQRNPQ